MRAEIEQTVSKLVEQEPPGFDQIDYGPEPEKVRGPVKTWSRMYDPYVEDMWKKLHDADVRAFGWSCRSNIAGHYVTVRVLGPEVFQAEAVLVQAYGREAVQKVPPRTYSRITVRFPLEQEV